MKLRLVTLAAAASLWAAAAHASLSQQTGTEPVTCRDARVILREVLEDVQSLKSAPTAAATSLWQAVFDNSFERRLLLFLRLYAVSEQFSRACGP